MRPTRSMGAATTGIIREAALRKHQFAWLLCQGRDGRRDAEVETQFVRWAEVAHKASRGR